MARAPTSGPAREHDEAAGSSATAECTRNKCVAVDEIERILAASRRDDPCAVLGVAVDATVVDIKRAWRKLVLLVHPDKVSGSEELVHRASEAFAAAEAAHSRLVEAATTAGAAGAAASSAAPSAHEGTCLLYTSPSPRDS